MFAGSAEVQIWLTVTIATISGIDVMDSRGDKMPLELFLSGIADWPRVLVLASETLMANCDV
jgi:hypothetical protein